MSWIIPSVGVLAALCVLLVSQPAFGAEPFPNSDRWNVRGTALGGLFVLEPWITPSLFYQFEGKSPNNTAVDIYHFCQVLGGPEANRQLQDLWSRWVTEEDIMELANMGLNSLRIPVGDYMYQPYGPYLNGCTKGAIDVLDTILGWAGKYNMKVVLDLHVTKGCQNGFDNGGVSGDLFWAKGGGRYNKTQSPRWLFSEYITMQNPDGGSLYAKKLSDGTFESPTRDFPKFTIAEMNQDNVQHTLQVLKGIAERYDRNPVVASIEVINEPWPETPIDALKEFYRLARKVIKDASPRMITMYHDSFRFDTDFWGGKLPGNFDDTVLDTHIYYAFGGMPTNGDLIQAACNFTNNIKEMRGLGTRVIVGEWAIATDSCAMFLTGFNFAAPQNYKCASTPCPTQFSFNHSVVPIYPAVSTVEDGFGPTLEGNCPITATPLNDKTVGYFARALMHAYSSGDGWYYWNFKTENQDPRWSYTGGVQAGYFPANVTEMDASVASACDAETIENACKNDIDCDGYIAQRTHKKIVQ